MRGEVYDGRNFVKSSMSGPPDDPKSKDKQTDIDLDVGSARLPAIMARRCAAST